MEFRKVKFGNGEAHQLMGPKEQFKSLVKLANDHMISSSYGNADSEWRERHRARRFAVAEARLEGVAHCSLLLLTIDGKRCCFLVFSLGETKPKVLLITLSLASDLWTGDGTIFHGLYHEDEKSGRHHVQIVDCLRFKGVEFRLYGDAWLKQILTWKTLCCDFTPSATDPVQLGAVIYTELTADEERKLYKYFDKSRGIGVLFRPCDVGWFDEQHYDLGRAQV